MPSQTTNFRLFQIEKVCRQQFQEGVRSRRSVRELRRFMKNHIQIYVPKCPRAYEKHLDLLKSTIPDIFTSILTILSIKTLEKLCGTL